MGRDDDDAPTDKPPGHFMEEEHEADTKRFVEHARELARRRAEEPFPDDDYAGGSASGFGPP